MNKEIFICKYKLIGWPFAVLTEEEAKAWVKKEPESRYYETVKIETIEL